MALKQKIRNRQGGFIVSAELMLITTILVIGMIVGLVAVRDAMVAEMHDIAEALGEMDQSFAFPGLIDPATGANTQGSSFQDQDDAIGGPGANSNVGNAQLGGDDFGIDFVTPDDDEGGAQLIDGQ